VKSPSPPVRRAAPGFTLVEVLVGALILGIFVSFVYGAVVSAFQVRTVVQTTTSALATGSMAVEIVARDLENAFGRPVQGGDFFKADEEGGDRARLAFLTTTDSRVQEEVDRALVRSDVTEVGYRTRQGEQGLVLYRREQFGVDDKPLEGGDWYKVAGGVQEFRVEWFEKDPSEEGGDADRDALKSWNAKEKEGKLPRAARIVLVLEGASSDPSHPDELMTYRFTRWVLLPGADDKPLPAAAAPGTNAPQGGNNPGGNNNPGGGGG
jgi:prepilin-type N-terminal cleavage/methylation domain-containing protein